MWSLMMFRAFAISFFLSCVISGSCVVSMFVLALRCLLFVAVAGSVSCSSVFPSVTKSAPAAVR